MRSVAAAKLKADWLQWWWCKRYNRPLKDPLLQEYTVEELQIEYFMDWIEKDPDQAFPRGEVGAFRTGDDYIDKIEEAIARGEEPDLDGDVDPEILANIKAFTKAEAQRLYPELREPGEDVELESFIEDGFSDSYDGDNDA